MVFQGVFKGKTNRIHPANSVMNHHKLSSPRWKYLTTHSFFFLSLPFKRLSSLPLPPQNLSASANAEQKKNAPDTGGEKPGGATAQCLALVERNSRLRNQPRYAGHPEAGVGVLCRATIRKKKAGLKVPAALSPSLKNAPAR